jgi:hypothetical protein
MGRDLAMVMFRVCLRIRRRNRSNISSLLSPDDMDVVEPVEYSLRIVVLFGHPPLVPPHLACERRWSASPQIVFGRVMKMHVMVGLVMTARRMLHGETATAVEQEEKPSRGGE